jgi:hypothetical protein
MLLRVPGSRKKVETWVRARGPFQLLPRAAADRGGYPLHIELWQVEGGALRLGEIDQNDWAERMGALVGGALGALVGMSTFGGSRAGSVAGARAFGASARALSERFATRLGTYHEMVVAVPVVLASAPRAAPYLLVASMVTDSPLARVADRALGFGYGKQRGSFERAANGAWTVRSSAGEIVLDVRPARGSENGVERKLPRASSASHRVRLDGVVPDAFVGALGSGGFAVSHLERAFSSPDTEVRGAPSVLHAGESLTAWLAGPLMLPAFSPVRRFFALRFSNLDVRLGYPTVLDESTVTLR